MKPIAVLRLTPHLAWVNRAEEKPFVAKLLRQFIFLDQPSMIMGVDLSGRYVVCSIDQLSRINPNLN